MCESSHQCVRAQPAVNAALWNRFPAAHCIQCLAVNISCATGRDTTAICFRDKEAKRLSGRNTANMLWAERTKEGRETVWSGSVRSNQRKHVDSGEQRHTLRSTHVQIHKQRAVVKLLTLYGISHTQFQMLRRTHTYTGLVCLGWKLLTLSSHAHTSTRTTAVSHLSWH